jgi:hypothetical protein
MVEQSKRAILKMVLLRGIGYLEVVELVFLVGANRPKQAVFVIRAERQIVRNTGIWCWRKACGRLLGTKMEMIVVRKADQCLSYTYSMRVPSRTGPQSGCEYKGTLEPRTTGLVRSAGIKG